MEIRFEAAGAAREEELLSLYDWLAADRALRGQVRVTRVAEPGAGTGRMGPGVDLVLAVLSAASGLGQLQLSYLAWRQSFRPQARITIDVTGADPDRVDELLRGFGQDGDDADGEPR
ncbi:effector-associated constant component EACC1 [Streptomyces olivaceoviridis]|uniref:effector-associated constant component EACC1 n=1 Tax=Streptomyces olivaceoviridis TaxID=1921 RepID=UPI0036B9E492